MCPWPKCEHIFYFSHFQNWKFQILAMWTHWVSTDFSFPTQILAICLNFEQQNSLFKINVFHTITSNSLKPSRCTPIHWELPENTKSLTWSAMVWEIAKWQNKLPCFIDRWGSSLTPRKKYWKIQGKIKDGNNIW